MDDQWFYGQDGTQRGPVTLPELQSLARTGQLRPLDLVWKQGMADWLPASTVMPELFVAAAPPPPPPVAAPTAPPVAPPIAPAPPTFSNEQIGYANPIYEGNSQNGRAVTSLVFGILSIPSCACPLVGIPFAIVAIVLGVGVKGGPNRGLAIGGIVCGGVGLLLNLPSSISWMVR